MRLKNFNPDPWRCSETGQMSILDEWTQTFNKRVLLRVTVTQLSETSTFASFLCRIHAALWASQRQERRGGGGGGGGENNKWFLDGSQLAHRLCDWSGEHPEMAWKWDCAHTFEYANLWPAGIIWIGKMRVKYFHYSLVSCQGTVKQHI